LDTRNKIVDAAAIPPGDRLVLVAGYFNPMLAPHARDLTEVRSRTGAETLVVVVLPYERELLSLRARQEMAASLRVVDYVLTVHTTDLEGLAASLGATELIHLEAADGERTRQLIEHVHRRQTR
jgi:hypothetical protein